jgi:hypothetical protein
VPANPVPPRPRLAGCERDSETNPTRDNSSADSRSAAFSLTRCVLRRRPVLCFDERRLNSHCRLLALMRRHRCRATRNCWFRRWVNSMAVPTERRIGCALDATATRRCFRQTRPSPMVPLPCRRCREAARDEDRRRSAAAASTHLALRVLPAASPCITTTCLSIAFSMLSSWVYLHVAVGAGCVRL